MSIREAVAYHPGDRVRFSKNDAVSYVVLRPLVGECGTYKLLGPNGRSPVALESELSLLHRCLHADDPFRVITPGPNQNEIGVVMRYTGGGSYLVRLRKDMVGITTSIPISTQMAALDIVPLSWTSSEPEQQPSEQPDVAPEEPLEHPKFTPGQPVKVIAEGVHGFVEHTYVDDVGRTFVVLKFKPGMKGIRPYAVYAEDELRSDDYDSRDQIFFSDEGSTYRVIRDDEGLRFKFRLRSEPVDPAMMICWTDETVSVTPGGLIDIASVCLAALSERDLRAFASLFQSVCMPTQSVNAVEAMFQQYLSWRSDALDEC